MSTSTFITSVQSLSLKSKLILLNLLNFLIEYFFLLLDHLFFRLCTESENLLTYGFLVESGRLAPLTRKSLVGSNLTMYITTVQIHTYIRTHTLMHTHIHTLIHTHSYIHNTYIHTHTHSYMHTYTHAYIYTFINIQSCIHIYTSLYFYNHSFHLSIR